MKKTFSIMFVCLFIDQLIKNILINIMDIGSSYTIIKNFFNITLVMNTGAAFSILSSNTLLLILISILVLIFIFFYLSKGNVSEKDYIIYGFLTGGVCGNLLDRIIHNAVIDYLDFNIFGYSFPVFNFADMLIVISMFLIILSLKDDKDEIHS